MIWFKQIVLLCLSPLTVSLGMMALGVMCLWIRRWLSLGKILATAGFALLVWAGLGQFGRHHLERLEQRYPPLDLSTLSLCTVTQINFVVVLGAGQVSDPRLPVTSQIGDRSLYRLVEGVRIHRRLPDIHLVLTGGPGIDTVPNAEVMAAVAVELGVERNKLIILNRPRDTHEEARSIKALTGTAPFILVTSAVHMPRAMRVFASEGLHPLPAPTGYVLPHSPIPDPARFFPTPNGLMHTDQALYEILGSIRETWRY